jgi:hypothetical protein
MFDQAAFTELDEFDESTTNKLGRGGWGSSAQQPLSGLSANASEYEASGFGNYFNERQTYMQQQAVVNQQQRMQQQPRTVQKQSWSSLSASAVARNEYEKTAGFILEST